MTRDRRRKRRVRARAAKTGESYTAALRHLRSSEELHMQDNTSFTLDVGGVTDIGRVRQRNEDHFLARTDLVAVADGMGGSGGGEVASRTAIETMQAAFADDPTAVGLIEAVDRANDAVRSQPVPDDADTDRAPGTTLAAVAPVAGDRLIVVNVGDTRVYLLRDGDLSLLSSDHSRVADLVRAGEIGQAEAADHPDRHVLTLALGPFERVAPAVGHLRPRPGDRLVVCSDGLFNEVGPDEMTEILTRPDRPLRVATALVERASANGGSDNATAVVLDVS